MTVPCISLNLGGAVTDSGITGGTDIGDWRYQVNDWSGLWGSIPIRGQHLKLNGRAGRTLTGSKLPDFRLFTLNLRSMPWDVNKGFAGGAGYTDVECGQIIENLLGMTGFFGEGTPLTVAWEIDTARTLYLQGWTIQGAPVTAESGGHRTIAQPLEASYPYWQQADIETDVITGVDTIVNPGTAAVWNAQLVFAGDGSLTNSTTSQVVTVSGSTGAVTIDVLTGSTTQGGVDADGLAVANTNQIMRFVQGTNNVTAAGTTVTVKWRPGYK